MISLNKYDPRYMHLQQEKLEAIIHKKQKVTEVAKEFNVSRKTVHIWLIKYKKDGLLGLIPKKNTGNTTAHNRTDKHTERIVISLALQWPTEGVESLADMLYYEQEITLHPTTIYRILKRNNIRYGPYHTRTHKRWKKKLYTHKTPGTELQMDTTYPYGYKAGKALYTIIDDASRWVYVKAYDKANSYNTILFLREIIQKAPFIIQKIRTDNGTEFTNDAMKIFLKTHNIVHRRNTVGCPQQNGKIERFHGTLKRAYKYNLLYQSSLDELQYRITLFTQYYNHRKRHRGLGMHGLTPIKKLEEYMLSTDGDKSVTLTLQCHKI